MTTYRFPEITVQVTRNLKCRTCSKRYRRSHTFSQTVNPFNKNAAGEAKTEQEIRAELTARAADWSPRDLCTACDTTEWD